MPFILALAPLSGIALYLADPRVEWLLVSASLIVATVSLTSGFRRHRSRQLLLLFLGAATVLIVARLGEELAWSIPARMMSIAGAVALASSHFWNAKLCRRQSMPHPRQAKGGASGVV